MEVADSVAEAVRGDAREPRALGAAAERRRGPPGRGAARGRRRRAQGGAAARLRRARPRRGRRGGAGHGRATSRAGGSSRSSTPTAWRPRTTARACASRPRWWRGADGAGGDGHRHPRRPRRVRARWRDDPEAVAESAARKALTAARRGGRAHRAGCRWWWATASAACCCTRPWATAWRPTPCRSGPASTPAGSATSWPTARRRGLRRRPPPGRVGQRRDRRRGHAHPADHGDRGRPARPPTSTT